MNGAFVVVPVISSHAELAGGHADELRDILGGHTLSSKVYCAA